MTLVKDYGLVSFKKRRSFDELYFIEELIDERISLSKVLKVGKMNFK